jgi:hypothetical protein
LPKGLSDEHLNSTHHSGPNLCSLLQEPGVSRSVNRIKNQLICFQRFLNKHDIEINIVEIYDEKYNMKEKRAEAEKETDEALGQNLVLKYIINSITMVSIYIEHRLNTEENKPYKELANIK